MEKKESPNKKDNSKTRNQPLDSVSAAKISGLSQKAFGVIKFILGLCLLPFVYSVSVAFIKEFSVVQWEYQNSFWLGVSVFLFVHLFIWEPAPIYNSGHKLLEIAFSFFQPFVKVAPYLLPIYTIILALIYAILSIFVKSSWLLNYTLFLLGFSIVLHLVFSARTVRSQKDDFMKGNYIFGFSFVYIINVTFIALILSLVLNNFFFGDFCYRAVTIYKDIFYAVFKQLFLY